MNTRVATSRPAVSDRVVVAGLGMLVAMSQTFAWAHAQSARPMAADANGMVEAARVSTVLADGSVDGRPVRIDRVVATETAAEAAHRTAARWRQDGDPVILLRSGPWQIASRLTPSGYQTAQLRDIAGGRSEGFIASWPLGPLPDRAAPPAWWPSGARLLRTVESTDGPRRAVTRIGDIALAPAAARGLIAARLIGQGWTVAASDASAARVPARPAPTTGGRPPVPPVPLHASRGAAAVVVTLEARATGAAFVALESEVSP